MRGSVPATNLCMESAANKRSASGSLAERQIFNTWRQKTRLTATGPVAAITDCLNVW